MTGKYSNLGEMWTEQDDLLLVEVVLRNIRNGNTIINACEEMEEVTNGRRTKSAAKFRWHTRLKAQYETAYQLAKKEGRKAKQEKKRNVNGGKNFNEIVETVVQPKVDEITIETITNMLVMYKNKEAEKYTEQIDKLEHRNKRLAEELDETKKLLNSVRNDYNELMKALSTLEGLGISVPVPKRETHTYKINSDGTIDRSN